MDRMIIQKIINIFKDRGFVDAFFIVSAMVLALFRGVLRGYPGVLIGSNVTLRSRRKLRIGFMTRIESFVELDAYGSHGINIGRYCKIGKYSILRVPGTPNISGTGIFVGDRTTFAEFCFVGGAGMVSVGTENSIGQYVSIHPQNHLNSDKLSKTHQIGVSIGNSNWIGAKVTILDGVTLENHNKIGAASVLTKSFDSGNIIVGIPARLR
jgi:acetyltransferase-like isoleucine patch superfamily enzyme